jgi:glucose/arabinose dehydrogenase
LPQKPWAREVTGLRAQRRVAGDGPSSVLRRRSRALGTPIASPATMPNAHVTGRWLALSLALCACTRQEPSARGPAPPPATGDSASASSVAQSGAPGDLASATPDNPLRPPAPSQLLATSNGAGDGGSKGPARLDTLRLPPGFSIGVYAANVPHARSLARGREGTTFVSTRRDDKVYALVDEDGDHDADRVYVVASGLDTPNGIAYRDGSLFIAEISRVLRIDEIDAHLAQPAKPVVVTDGLPDREQHGWRYIRFGPDGLLYIPIGAPCNVCAAPEPIFSSIARMKADGSGLEVFARGVRNSVGFDWHPQTQELWFTENGRDELGDDIPPDELDRAPRAGLDFGFPACHAGVIVDPEYAKGHECTEYEPPVQRLGPHVAALGMRFYTGKMFPTAYEGAAIIAEHGSWNRSNKLGYRVMVVRLEQGRAVSYEPLVSGFLNESQDTVSGRPVDVELLDDGSLLVSDDYGGVVYRVSYARP